MFKLNGVYATVQESAEMLDVTVSYIRRLLRRGDIEGAIKIGRDWIISVEDGKIKIKEKTDGNAN